MRYAGNGGSEDGRSARTISSIILGDEKLSGTFADERQRASDVSGGGEHGAEQACGLSRVRVRRQIETRRRDCEYLGVYSQLDAIDQETWAKTNGRCVRVGVIAKINNGAVLAVKQGREDRSSEVN